MQEEFDIIVIGSGLGGLECGVMLSREGVGVCVVEQAAVPGGCLQSFRRRGHSIDTGMHYVGSMQQGGIMRRYFDYFGIGIRSKYGRSTKRSTSYRRAETESSPTCTATTNSGGT